MMEESKYHRLIMKQLKGESTRAEDSELQNWLYESEQNQEIFKQVANLWKVTQPISEPDFPDMDEEWCKLANKFGLNGESNSARVIRLDKKEVRKSVSIPKMGRFRYLAAAAVFAVIIGFSYWSIFRSAQNFIVIETKNAETKQINLEDGSIWTIQKRKEHFIMDISL